MEELTKTEERIMLIIWKLKKAFVKDIIDQLPDDPKPPYNTVSSVVRILNSKGYLDFKAYGKTYEYYPVVSKQAYRKMQLKKLLAGYFSGSPASLVSAMMEEEALNQEEIRKLKELINKIE